MNEGSYKKKILDITYDVGADPELGERDVNIELELVFPRIKNVNSYRMTDDTEVYLGIMALEDERGICDVDVYCEVKNYYNFAFRGVPGMLDPIISKIYSAEGKMKTIEEFVNFIKSL